MIIAVTDKDIAEGNSSSNACPITIALRRCFGDRVSISRNFIRVFKKNSRAKDKWVLVPLPKNAQTYLLDYYKHYATSAFKFSISDKHVKLLKG